MRCMLIAVVRVQDCAARAYQLWQRFKERGWQLTASHYHQLVAVCLLYC
jgi:hypothetical protein